MLQLNVPHLLSVDPSTLNKIRADHSEEFVAFRDAVLDAVKQIKEVAGDEGYEREVRRIQRDIIDDPLNVLRTKMNSVVKMRAIRQIGGVVGTGITYLLAGIGAPEFITVSVAGATLVQLVESMKARINEEEDITKLLKEPMFFIWQVERQVQR